MKKTMKRILAILILAVTVLLPVSFSMQTHGFTTEPLITPVPDGYEYKYVVFGGKRYNLIEYQNEPFFRYAKNIMITITPNNEEYEPIVADYYGDYRNLESYLRKSRNNIEKHIDDMLRALNNGSSKVYEEEFVTTYGDLFFNTTSKFESTDPPQVNDYIGMDESTEFTLKISIKTAEIKLY